MPRHLSLRNVLVFMLLALAATTTAVFIHRVQAQPAAANLPPIIFVARAHLATADHIFRDEVGPAGQFGTGIAKYAPGSKLVRRNADGSLFVYNTPGLVDVQSPDVSFDGSKIVFAGAKTINESAPDYGWRLYEINVDGSGFRQLTFSDRTITIPNAANFGNADTYGHYHDLFPAYLADGRIAFNSSRYPTRSHYDSRETFNVYLMDGDGGNLRRITTERASVLHPTPLPDGRLLVSRWWNQFNQPSDLGIYNRIDDDEYSNVTLADGTIVLANDAQFNPANAILPGGFEVRKAPNTWHLMTLHPDGTNFQRFAWTPRYPYALTNDSGSGDTYAGAQPAVIIQNDDLANPLVAYTSQQDQTMVHTTLETGIRVAHPGVNRLYANATDAIAGLTYDKAWGQDDDSGPYAIHPAGLPDGRILYAQSSVDNSLPTGGVTGDNGDLFDLQGSNLRYRLYVMNVDGSGKALVGVNLGSVGLGQHDVMDAVPVTTRSGWQAMADVFTAVAPDNPLAWDVPNTMAAYAFTQKGPGDIETATMHNPNIYANPSLFTPYVNNSPPPGSVATAEIWVDANQFTGAYCYNGWPQPCGPFRKDTEVRAILWDTVPVVDGAFTATVPADVMNFIVLRDANGRLVRNWNRGYATIAQGSSWARPGETVTCVGCHMGHVSGSLDDVMADATAGWQNVAPFAVAAASSYHATDYDTFVPGKINDRRGWVPLPAGGPQAPFFDEDYQLAYQDDETGWKSENGRSAGEWVELTWPSNMTVKQIRLVGPPPNGGDWGGFGDPAQYGDYAVTAATLRLYRDGALVRTIDVGQIDPLSAGGTLIDVAPALEIDRLRLTVNETTGRFYWSEVAAVNEIEVIGRDAEPWPLLEISDVFLPLINR